jgi:hypothetical protein
MGSTPIGSNSPVELTFADGVYVNGISGTSDTMINSLKFTSSDGMEITCGAPGMGDAFDPISGYLIGIDGHFSEYLDRTAMKTMPEAAAQALL